MRRALLLALAGAAPAVHAQVVADAVADAVRQPTLVVTAARESELLNETPASIGVIDGASVRRDRPTHPAQIMSQVPGVAVAVTSGEGHSTAIRQPFTTNPVYLFLEDGVPIRSTGFFNHNALYEINIPSAGGIEITRGPGTALYGSDAIGGIINVLTRTPPSKPEFSVAPDAGSFGWRRLVMGGGTGRDQDAWRGDLNLTHTDGWRESTAYDRQSGVARWDHTAESGATFTSVLSFSRIDQQTGANSPLVHDDYRDHPTRNYLPIAFRKVGALRMSTSWEKEWGDSLVSLTPYVRDNSMDLLASYLLNSDPTLAKTKNQSYGVLAKWRRDWPRMMRARVIVGADIDVSPGGREEDRLNVSPTGSGASRVFDAYTVGPRVYDYDVTFNGISPYVHAEASPLARLRVTAGMRYDALSYRFDNHLAGDPIRVPGAFPGVRFYGQADDTTKRFHNTTPKFGATYELAKQASLYVSHNDGFRAPSEAQIFRPSAATSAAAAAALVQSALQLKPIKARQAEVGMRGVVAGVSYDIVAYRLVKRDDIITFRDTATNFTQSVNAGRTSHRGVEVGLGTDLGSQLSVAVAFSHARHTYEDWVTASGNFSGNEIESAPRTLSNVSLTWKPRSGTRATLEWVKTGDYWLDAANTTRYGGHSLLNARANWAITRGIGLFASVTNLADRRYADSASITSSTPVFSPGLPRAYYAGAEFKW